jgi:cytochrome c oxidase subunit 2
MSRETLASCMIPNDSEAVHLRSWLADPQAIKPGCLMPSFGLNDRQLDSLTGYLQGLR